MQAAILRIKLGHLDRWNARRKAIATAYAAGLEGTSLVIPAEPSWAEPAWHLYVVRSSARDELQKRLGERGIETAIHYPVPPHLQQAYAHLEWRKGDFPVAERIHREVLSLPIGPHLDDVVLTSGARLLAGAANRSYMHLPPMHLPPDPQSRSV